MTSDQFFCQITSGRLDNAVEATHFINNILPDPVTPQTVRNTLKQNDFCAVVKRKCPLLKKAHRLDHLKFARYHENWTVEDQKRILWSDETKISRIGSDGRAYTWKQKREPLSNRTTPNSQAWRREQSYGMGLYGVEWSRGAHRGSGDHERRAIL